MDDHGIFGSASPLASYNRVWVPQCSSDAWMGDIGANESAAGVNWRGSRIMRAALQDMVTRGLKDGDFMLFGGLSAGARGAMVHLDTINSTGAIPSGVSLLGYLDSPYYIEMQPFQNLTQVEHRVAEETQAVACAMQNEDILRGDGACELDEAWKCGFGEYRIPLLKTPFLLVASQYDWYGLMTAMGASLSSTECFPDPQCPYYKYADEFKGITRQGLSTLPQVISGKSGLYSSTCYDHAITKNDNWGDQEVDGVTHPEALSQAIAAFQGHGEMPVVMSKCNELNCGKGCLVEIPSTCGCFEKTA